MRIGVDLSPVVRNRNSPAAFTVRERLEALRRANDGIELFGLAPGNLDEGIISILDGWIERKMPTGSAGKLWFEQRHLARFAEKAAVDLLFIMGRRAPLRSPVPVVVELAPRLSRQPNSLWERLEGSIAQAGAEGASLRYTWNDFEFKREQIGIDRSFTPFVDPQFRVTESSDDSIIRQELGLPSAYVLSHGITPDGIPWLLAAWSWIDSSVGDQIPLVLTGVSAGNEVEARREIERMNLEDSVQLLGSVKWNQLPALYRGAQAFLHTGASEIGQEFRWALAAGVPIASVDESQAAAIAGEAAYLSPAGDARALGAACLTLLVEPEAVAKPLRQKGLIRAGAYHGGEPLNAWYQAFKEVYDSAPDRGY